MKKDTAYIAIMDVLLACSGAALLFVPSLQLVYIIYGFLSLVVIAGIIMMIRYFMTNSYKDFNAYGFSEGTLLVILGICGLIKATALESVFYTGIGLVLIFSCVIKLQYTLDLSRMGDKLFYLLLVLVLVLTGCGIAVLLNPFTDPAKYTSFVHLLLLIDGAFSLLFMLYLALRIRAYTKKEAKEQENKEKLEQQESLTDQNAAEGNLPESDTTKESK
ncbi:MAG: hypothetical protein II798_01575 [Lachnospiraceae bacterium]|nr:hypothetical protein [Lachnospiraceae bacterium]